MYRRKLNWQFIRRETVALVDIMISAGDYKTLRKFAKLIVSTKRNPIFQS